MGAHQFFICVVPHHIPAVRQASRLCTLCGGPAPRSPHCHGPREKGKVLLWADQTAVMMNGRLTSDLRRAQPVGNLSRFFFPFNEAQKNISHADQAKKNGTDKEAIDAFLW